MAVTSAPKLIRLVSESLRRQVCERLREAILAGQFPPGSRLPSSRMLAVELGVSRNTVLAAFEQLYAQGYIEGRRGSGTYVSEALPEEFLRVGPNGVMRSGERATAQLSKRGQRIVESPRTPLPVLADNANQRAFTIGLPDNRAFPYDVWLRLTTRRLRGSSWELTRYNHPAGYARLREAIAARLTTLRGVRCSAEQVIIVTGSQQALDFCARMLLDPGDSAWVEDPGYLGARAALVAAGARLVPIPTDHDGLDVSAGLASAPDARLTVVTPSHQFPLGSTLSLARRLALIDWASRTGSWVIEDDYDAEFRYVGRPYTALQGIDQRGCVIYVGTFSKAVFPGLRLGYIVVPHQLVDAFVAAHLATDIHTHVLEQAVLADFIESGQLDRHLRFMRVMYAERQELLVEAAQRELGGVLQVKSADSGLHLVGWLASDLDDEVVTRKAARQGVDVWPLSAHALHPYPRDALLLGYAAFSPSEIRWGIQRLARALNC